MSGQDFICPGKLHYDHHPRTLGSFLSNCIPNNEWPARIRREPLEAPNNWPAFLRLVPWGDEV